MAKFIALESGVLTEKSGLVTSSGAADGNKLVETDSTGRISTSVLPVGIGADTYSGTANENLAAGDFVYIMNTGAVAKASAGVSGVPAVGFVLTTAATGTSALVYFEGRNTSLSGLTAGTRYYLSETAGGVTGTPVVGSGKKHQYLGTAITTTSMNTELSDHVVLV